MKLDDYLFAKRFLAHATDGELSDEEFEVIVEDLAEHTRLMGMDAKQWQLHLDAVAERYDSMLRLQGPNAVVEHFRTCIGTLHEMFADREGALERLLSEFRRLADADGEIHPMEEHFLQEIERRWKKQVASQAPRSNLDPADDAGIAKLRPYLFCKLYLAHGADGRFTQDEARSIKDIIARHAARMELGPAARARLLHEMRTEYATLHRAGDEALRDRFRGALWDVRAHFRHEPDVLDSLVDEMHELAAADGRIDDEESQMLVEIATSWQRTDPV